MASMAKKAHLRTHGRAARLSAVLSLAALLALMLLLSSVAVPATESAGALHAPAPAPAAACAPPPGAAAFNASAAPEATFNSSRTLEVIRQHGALGCQPGMPIPRIIHHVHLPDIQQLLDTTTKPNPTFHLEWATSCLAMHPHFTHLYWDAQAARALVETHYPSFLPVYDNLPWDMKKADSVRYLIMDHFGGIYLDYDVQCYRPADDLLAGHDIVMQGTIDPEFLSSAILASVPKHPLWTRVVDELVKRFHAFSGQERSGHVLDLTGPFTLRDALKAYLFGDSSDEHSPKVAGGEHQGIRIYEMGTFFAPCFWYDEECHKRMARMQRLGTVPASLAGRHYYKGSWWGGEGNTHSSDEALADA